MPVIASWLKVDAERVVQTLEEACEKVESADGDLVLDFSSLTRLDAAAISALEDLAAAADQKGIKIALRGVNVDIYKVLKLVRLTQRFSFRSQ
ncbi:MAG: anti-sigma factor antagonist [Acidobacteria bacterium]|nr:anti-sigma factor antagonist [Acidobacteriota bacterium]